MKTFIVRHPILDCNYEVIGYELLFKGIVEGENKVGDNYSATLKLLKNLILNHDIKDIVDSKRVFIRFNEALLLDDAPSFIKAEKLVIELSPISEENPLLIEKLKEYKDKGCLMAYDLEEEISEGDALLPYIDMFKLDFSKYGKDQLKRIADYGKKSKKILFAYNVEEKDMLELAKDMGCTIFQGICFQRPDLIESQDMTIIPAVYIELIKEINKEVIDFTKLASIIKKDTMIMLSILKMINSAAYYSNHKVTSIREALVRIGGKESKKVIIMNMMKMVTFESKSTELLNISLQRAKQAEKLAPYFGLDKRKDELFLVGLLSLINIIMKKPMGTILGGVPLEEDITKALLGERNNISIVLEVIILAEMEAYKEAEMILKEVGCNIQVYNEIYAEAIVWANKMSIE